LLPLLFLASVNCNPTPNATECTKEQLDERNRCENTVETSSEYGLLKARLQAVIPQCITNYPFVCTRRNELTGKCMEQLEFNVVQNQSQSSDEKRKYFQVINNCLPSFFDEFWTVVEDKLKQRQQQQNPQNGQQQNPNGQQQSGPKRQQRAAITPKTTPRTTPTTHKPTTPTTQKPTTPTTHKPTTPTTRKTTPKRQVREANFEQKPNGNDQCIPNAQHFSCLIDALIQTNQMADMSRRLLQQQRQCKNTSENCQFEANFNKQDCFNQDLKPIVDQLKGQLQECVVKQGESKP